MARPPGRNVPLSLPRRFVGDLVHAARAMPLATVERRMRLAAFAGARPRAAGRPGCCALFTKAFALVAAGRPELRRSFVAWPRPHLYEHPVSVAAVAIARPVGDEEGVLFAHVRTPDRHRLRAIDRHLRRAKELPLESVALFRRILKTSALPLPLRRLVWWWGTCVSGRRRARYLGTFAVSAVSNLCSASPHLLTPVSCALSYGVVSPGGAVDVYLTFDQRVLGAAAAVALEEMEGVLNGEIREELGGEASPGAVAPGLEPMNSGAVSRQ